MQRAGEQRATAAMPSAPARTARSRTARARRDERRTRAPIPAPTIGNSAPPRATSAASSAIHRPTGTRVRKATAAAARPQRPASVTPAPSNVAISSRIAIDARRSGKRQRGAAALPEPQLEVEQRLEAEGLEHERVPGLRRAVRGDHHVGRSGLDAYGGERRGARDEPVEQGRSAGAQPSTSPARNAISKPPSAASGSTVAPSVLTRERAPHRVDLARDARVVEARCRGRRRAAGSTSRSAAVSALAEVVFPIPISPSATTSTVPELVGERRPRVQCALHLSARHRRPLGQVRRCRHRPEPRGRAVRRTGRDPDVDDMSSAPACRARTLIAAPPAAKFATICAVTSCGYADTPAGRHRGRRQRRRSTASNRVRHEAADRGDRGTRDPRAGRDCRAASSSRRRRASRRRCAITSSTQHPSRRRRSSASSAASTQLALTRPSTSRYARASALSGTMPIPTSLRDGDRQPGRRRRRRAGGRLACVRLRRHRRSRPRARGSRRSPLAPGDRVASAPTRARSAPRSSRQPAGRSSRCRSIRSRHLVVAAPRRWR